VLVGLLALLGWAASPAGAAKPPPTSPTEITVTLKTNIPGLGGAVPEVLALPGDPILLTLAITQGETFNQDVVFRLDDGSAPGDLSPDRVTLPAGLTSVQQEVSYSAVASGVTLTPVFGGKGKAPAFTVGVQQPFDIVRTLELATKGDTVLGDTTCTIDSPDTNCGIVMLPKSFTSEAAALTTGAPAAVCGTKPCAAALVQFTAAMEGLYTAESPATIIFRCDKSLCGKGGVNKFTVYFSYASVGDLRHVAPACLVKGQANPDTDELDGACVDYVNSQRDNAGDTLLHFNFIHDLRGSGF
jgi:hypothetical protein